MNKIKINKLNNWIIACTAITFLLGVADLVLDILHTKGDMIGTWFLIVAIVMSIPAIAWIVLGIIIIVKDKNVLPNRTKTIMLTIIVISIAAFIPLWAEAFIEGNGIPMFKRAMFRQVLWMGTWILYLLTNVGIFIISLLNKQKYLQNK